MKMLSLIIIIGIFSIGLVTGDAFNVSCGLNEELNGAFPSNTFNSSCVSSSCPNLNKCSASGSTYDLNSTLITLFDCAKGSSICGMKIEPRPIPVLDFVMNDLLQNIPLTGFCRTSTNCCSYKNVIPTFTVISANKVSLSLPKLSFVGNVQCTFVQSFISNLKLPLPSVTLPTMDVGYEIDFSYSSTLLIDSAGKVEIIDPQLQVTDLNSMGLQFPSFPGVSDYMPTFKSLNAKYLMQMGLSTFLENFYEGLIQSAIQVAADKCN